MHTLQRETIYEVGKATVCLCKEGLTSVYVK